MKICSGLQIAMNLAEGPVLSTDDRTLVCIRSPPGQGSSSNNYVDSADRNVVPAAANGGVGNRQAPCRAGAHLPHHVRHETSTMWRRTVPSCWMEKVAKRSYICAAAGPGADVTLLGWSFLLLAGCQWKNPCMLCAESLYQRARYGRTL